MAAQAALIEETIIGLKKALRRENECKFCAEENIHMVLVSDHSLTCSRQQTQDPTKLLLSLRIEETSYE